MPSSLPQTRKSKACFSRFSPLLAFASAARDLFPALPLLCLSHKPAQATIFYHKPTACLPSLAGCPSRRHGKVKFDFPTSPAVGFCVCRSRSFPCSSLALPFHKPAQSTIFYHKSTACLPSPAFPRTKKGLPPTFSPRSSFPPLPPLFAFSTISKRFYALPFPRSGLFLFPFFRSSLPFRKL